jgi:uncharacterized damage-inducible protein DinB
MNDVLLDAFRHNSWATKQLLAVCRTLSEDQLTAGAPSSFGSILATLNHVIRSDAGYLRSLSGTGPTWLLNRAESADFDQLSQRVEETERNWERFLSQPLDGERVLMLDQGTYEAHAGVLIAQALHHGNAHREQICAMLTSFGVEPPDIQAWAYAHATGRGRERRPDH